MIHFNEYATCLRMQCNVVRTICKVKRDVGKITCLLWPTLVVRRYQYKLALENLWYQKLLATSLGIELLTKRVFRYATKFWIIALLGRKWSDLDSLHPWLLGDGKVDTDMLGSCTMNTIWIYSNAPSLLHVGEIHLWTAWGLRDGHGSLRLP